MLQRLFFQCDQLLSQYQSFWQYQPFYFPDLAACEALPESLRLALADLSAEQFAALNQHPAAGRTWLSRWIPCFDQIDQLEQMITPPREFTPVDRSVASLSSGIPGRKWQQILQFSQQVAQNRPSSAPTTRLLEWCAGKGHLGRLLSLQYGYQVTSLEWQQSLCHQGALLVTEKKRTYPHLRQQFQQGDALSSAAGELLKDYASVVALHACGDLHTRLISHCSQHADTLQQIAIAPCCYHLTGQSLYQACSAVGQQSRLSLSRQDLKIPLQETVTGGLRIGRLRDQELLWRLSFDSLRQKLTGIEGYQPLPGFKKQRLSGEFRDFVRWALSNRELMSPQQLDQTPECLSDSALAQALEEGRQRLLTVRKLEWLQSGFRRLLEIWLVTDRALALEEAGFHVELHQLCEKSISPRNLLILARGQNQPIN